MKYKGFNDIEIEIPRGVCPVSGDTFLIAKHVATKSPRKCIDVGTGSGFVAIYLATLGFTCAASDVHKKATGITLENARRNNVAVKIYESNLFESIEDSFDVIIFNPPYGNVSSTALTPVLEFIKSLIPRNNKFISQLSYELIKKSRRKLIVRFLQEAKEHLAKDGMIVILLHQKELDLVEELNAKAVGSWREMKLVEISF